MLPADGVHPDQLTIDAGVRRVTWVGLVINLVLSTLKVLAGVVGHSQAMVADGIHSISDMATDVAILVGVRYWSKPPDENHPHGHWRVETVVTLAIGLVLVGVAAGLVWNAIATIQEPHAFTPQPIALVAALVSIVVKEWLYRYTVRAGRRLRSMPLMANAWHHRSDALSSVPAALAVATVLVWPSLIYVDHIGAVVVGFFIVRAAIKIVTPTVGKLLDVGASEEIRERIRQITCETAGVQDTHKLRTRYLGCSALQADLHIQVDDRLTVREGHSIAGAVKHRLETEVDELVDVVVHVEPADGHVDAI